MKKTYGVWNGDWEFRLVEPEHDDELDRLIAESDRIRNEIRTAVEPAPRWAQWLMTKIWPRIFA